MKDKRLVIILGMAILLAAVVTPSFAKDGHRHKDANTIEVKSGKEFVITLKSNMTTGYQWQLTKAVDKDFLVLTGLKYITKKTKVVGAGGKEEWSFKAVKPGKAVIGFQYVRPWEKKEPPARVRKFTVIIKQ